MSRLARWRYLADRALWAIPILTVTGSFVADELCLVEDELEVLA